MASVAVDDQGYENPDQETEEFEWAIDLRTIVNEDSGDTILIMTHELKAKILYADTLIFNVKFTATNEGAGTVIDADAARCTMENDSRNTDYWIVSVEDGHYPTGGGSYTKDANAGATDNGQDWFTERDDIDMDTHLCTKPSGSDNYDPIERSYFACKELHCELRRKFDTEDVYDIDFVSTGSPSENMLIAAGAATLQINQDGESNLELVENRAAKTIKVVKGAVSSIVTSALAVSALAMAFSF